MVRLAFCLISGLLLTAGIATAQDTAPARPFAPDSFWYQRIPHDVEPHPDLWRGTPVYRVLSGFPWDKLQFLPIDCGKPR